MSETIFQNSINKLFDSIVWTHKIQRTYLEVLEERRKTIKILKILFTAIASICTAAFAIFNNQVGTISSSLATICTIFLGDILDKIETKENIQAFKDSSTKLFEIRNQLIILRDRIKEGKMPNDVIAIELGKLNTIYAFSQRDLPTVPDKIVEKASKKLKDRKDEEVDFKLWI